MYLENIKKIEQFVDSVLDSYDSAIKSYEELTEEQRKELNMTKEEYNDAKYLNESFIKDEIIKYRTIIGLKKTMQPYIEKEKENEK